MNSHTTDSGEEFKLSIENVKKIGFGSNETSLSYDDLGFEAFSLLRVCFFSFLKNLILLALMGLIF